ncbi:MAG: MotA/TolQ/ExbB proton channel family protein [Bacteroidales bacterium]|nr:MotA/TolQ/ExbB proton channel family protein [Bacteroidales bacterium]MDT8429917.1 MotA/TolQ/ExbB proton channel family protein [Bacteroidales bacterium]
MKSIIEKMNDGGPLITYTILLLILIILALFIWTLLESDKTPRNKSLIASLGWFALAWGYLGRTYGLILAFDKIAAAGEITPSLMAGGLKMALLGPLAGLTAFLIARMAIIIFILRDRKTGTA